MWWLFLCRHEIGVGVEPEAVDAEGADAAPGLALAVVDGEEEGARQFRAR